ncbi:MAG: hypothetical protein JWO05_3016 [Gemmatimonadetes bacterium]|nr:hypothetical protein [Gemmatimonadota bacterium]
MRITPKLIRDEVRDETYAGLTYHIEGDTVPTLHIELGRRPVYFEHHVLLWKHSDVEIEVKSLQGAFKRAIAGMSIFVTQAAGPGHIAFSRDGPGQLIAIHMKKGDRLDVREHQFLAATDGVDYTFQRVKGAANMFLGGSGFFIDTFDCEGADEGILWLHGYGNVFEVTLEAGQQIDIEPGGWVYKSPTVTMQTIAQSVSLGLLASSGQIVFNRFSGPGRVGIQSMYMHLPTGE